MQRRGMRRQDNQGHLQRPSSGISPGISAGISSIVAQCRDPEFAPRLIHPSLDYQESFASIGVVDENKRMLRVMADGDEVAECDALRYPQERPRRPPLGDKAGALASERTAELPGWRPAPAFGQVMSWALMAVDRHLELRRDEEAVVVAAWCVGTYFFPLFRAYPRLNLHGERGSGKSRYSRIPLWPDGSTRSTPRPRPCFAPSPRYDRPLRRRGRGLGRRRQAHVLAI